MHAAHMPSNADSMSERKGKERKEKKKYVHCVITSNAKGISKSALWVEGKIVMVYA
jgi:hypothetical protein